jgi:hypothetical protein
MASFSAGTTFTDGVANDVTAAKLAALVNAATPTSGLIQDRTAETTIAADDTLLFGDFSDSNNLKRMTVANFAGTLPTATITSGTITTLNSTTGTITTLNSTTPTFLGAITASTNTINVGSGQIFKDASGNVGIGTTSPSDQLHINKSSNATIRLQSSSNTCFVEGNNNYLDLHGGSQAIRMVAGSTERLRIDSSGNVGIGTATAIGKFTVEASGSSTSNIPLTTNSTTGAGNRFAAGFYYSGTKVGSIEVTASATSYVTSSDYRLKTNLEPISNGIERVKQLPVYRFNWIADEGGNKVDGFVAHEAKAIVPECVSGEKDAVDSDGKPIHQGIDQSKIVPLLTAALKEAIAKIETLEAKVTALEAA